MVVVGGWVGGVGVCVLGGGKGAGGRGECVSSHPTRFPFLASCSLRTDIENQLGRVDDQPLLHLAQQQQALQRWQQQLSPQGALPGMGAGKAGAAVATAAGAAGSAALELPSMSAEDAVLAVCGVAPEAAAAGVRGSSRRRRRRRGCGRRRRLPGGVGPQVPGASCGHSSGAGGCGG